MGRISNDNVARPNGLATTKQCNVCQQYKELTEFSKDKNKIDGLSNCCKFCAKERSRLYYEQHREQRLQYQNNYRLQNNDNINKKKKEHYYANRDRIIVSRRNKYQEYKNDPMYKLNRSISKAVWEALKGNKLEQHWEDIVGWSIEQLKQHLEKQFTSDMNWNNYGSYWEVDHIIPKNTFTINSFKICWSLPNLRPLEKKANKSRPKDGSDISDDVKQIILGQYI